MFKKGNNIEIIKKINQEWIDELSEDPQLIPLILVYEPFTEEYWKEKYRIVWYNLEPGGYIENNNEKVLKLESYKRLLHEKNQTLINTSLFIYCLYNRLNGIEIGNNEMEAARKNIELLMDCMKKVTYMNLLKDAGNPKFTNKYFWEKFFNDNVYPKNRERIKNMNDALNPNILIVTGNDGKALFEQLYNENFIKDNNYSFVHNDTLFVNINHPSPMGVWKENKNYISDNVNMIIESMKSHKLLN